MKDRNDIQGAKQRLEDSNTNIGKAYGPSPFKSRLDELKVPHMCLRLLKQGWTNQDINNKLRKYEKMGLNEYKARR